MQSNAQTPEEYIAQLPKDSKPVIEKLRKAIKDNLPAGFEERMSYGILGYVVPHTIYPSGYHCTPKLPLPFINVASQKKIVAVYHMGIYANKELMDWFIEEYPKHCKTKLDMGKSCIRFKKLEDIPFELIGELCGKITVEEWVTMYENMIKR